MSSRVAKSGFALVLFLYIVSFAVAQQAPSQLPQAGTLIGTVLDVTGGTVPNAVVRLQQQGNARSVVTGPDGFFKFDEVPPGTPIRVEISASDLKDWTSREIIV